MAFLLIAFYSVLTAFGSAFAITDAAAIFLRLFRTGTRWTWRRRWWWSWLAGPVIPGIVLADIKAATIEYSLPDNIVAGRH